MRARYIAALGCCVLAAACADRSGLVPDIPQNLPSSIQFTPMTPAQIEGLIEQVVGQGNNERKYALTQFRQIVALVTPTALRQAQAGLRASPTATLDTAAARVLAIALIQHIKGLYDANLLIGGQSQATQTATETLFNAILVTVGLPPTFGPGSLGQDGSTAFIYPTTGDTVVETGTGWAGVSIPAASVTTPTVVTIQRLPDFPGPLLTPLDQYPIYYEFHASTLPFTNDVVVGVCQASNVNPPDPTRLRIAHNVGSAAVITPLAPAPFLDCSAAPIASASSRWGFDLASTGRSVGRGLLAVVLPKPLFAAPMFGTGGVGGTVREFSPFGAVDTLGSMAWSGVTNEFHGKMGQPATEGRPTVRILTPTGRPMAGIPVQFTKVSGGGTLNGGSTVTDANGYASSGVWIMSPVKECAVAWATATMPAGSGLTGNPVRFWGCSRK